MLLQNSPLLKLKLEAAQVHVIKIEKKTHIIFLYFHSYTHMPVYAQRYCKHS